MDRAEGVLLVAELALREARAVSARVDEIPSARIAKSFVINTSGELVVVYDDGTTSIVGEVKGKDGENGAFISEGEINEEGNLLLNLSDGRVINAGMVRGENGKDGISLPGPSGRSITNSRIDENGNLILSFTDGINEDVGKVKGNEGQEGVGIEKIEINSKYELIITLTNEKNFNLGNVRGEIGTKGDVGEGPIGPEGPISQDWETIERLMNNLKEIVTEARSAKGEMALSVVISGLDKTIKSINAPKKIIRDKNGKPIGIESGKI